MAGRRETLVACDAASRQSTQSRGGAARNLPESCGILKKPQRQSCDVTLCSVVAGGESPSRERNRLWRRSVDGLAGVDLPRVGLGRELSTRSHAWSKAPGTLRVGRQRGRRCGGVTRRNSGVQGGSGVLLQEPLAMAWRAVPKLMLLTQLGRRP